MTNNVDCIYEQCLPHTRTKITLNRDPSRQKLGKPNSDRNSSDFIECQSIGCSVVKFGRSRRYVGDDSLSVFNGPAVFQIGGDPGGSKGMAADALRADCRSQSPASDSDGRENDRILWVKGDRKNSRLFIDLLKKLLVNPAYAQKTVIHVVLDNYAIHSSKQTRLWLAEFGGKFRCTFCRLLSARQPNRVKAVA